MALTAQIKGDKLIITIDIINPPRLSKSGGSTVIASSNGNHATSLIYDNKPVIIGLNAYVK